MCILAIDLGTSSIKLLRLDGAGHIISIDRIPHRQLDVTGWIEAIGQHIADHGYGNKISALSITGQMHGLITHERGTWGVGIPWHDQRATAILPDVKARLGDGAVTVTGGPLAAGFQAASLAWLRAHQPERWRGVERVFLPKDALIFALTGHHVTDPSDAVGTGCFAPETGQWAWDIVDTLGVSHDWMPNVIPSGSIVGNILPDSARALGVRDGIPVIVAGGDAPVGAYGAGVTREGDALVLLSSGGQVILPIGHWTPDPHGRWYSWPSVTQDAQGAPWLRVGTLLNGGNVMEWSAGVLGDGALAETPTSLISLPHLIGTREHPAQRGAVIGVTPRTTPDEMRRGWAEGIAFSVRRTLDEMTAGGSRPARIRIGGGLAHRSGFRQLFADVLGIPCDAIAQNDLSAYGAGMLALVTLTGSRPSVEQKRGTPTFPIAHHARHYDATYDLYRELDNALVPLSESLEHTVSNPE